MSTTNPVSPKVKTAAVGSGVAIAITTVAVYIIETAASIDIPSPVEGAIAIIVGAAGAFVGGYIKRDPARHVA
jgi:multisubunit Na+/H+ antiporter MnhB subunit